MSLFSKAEGAGASASRAGRVSRNGSGAPASILAEASRLEGVARFEGPARIDGMFDGSIEVGDTLVIGKSGSFSGEIRARSVVVAGTVRGSILASHSVELQKGSRVEGDVHTRTLVVEDGVFFQGYCRMEELADETSDGMRLPKPRPAAALPPELPAELPRESLRASDAARTGPSAA